MTESALAVSTTPDMAPLMRAAIDKGAEGVAALERLVELQRSINRDMAAGAFHRAMAAFRAEMPAITKCVPGQHGVNRVGTRTKGMYAPLDAITAVLDPICAKHGLSYRFDREEKNGKDYILCIVSHELGHEVASRFPAPADTGPGRTAIQAIASGESYAKRYALTAAFAITTADPDDDGATEAQGETITEEQALTIDTLLKDTGSNRPRFLEFMRVEKIEDIRAADFKRATAMLDKKARQK